MLILSLTAAILIDRQPLIDQIVYPSNVVTTLTGSCPQGELRFSFAKHPSQGLRLISLQVGETAFPNEQIIRLRQMFGMQTVNYAGIRDCGADGDERIRVYVSFARAVARSAEDLSIISHFDIRGSDIVPAQ